MRRSASAALLAFAGCGQIFGLDSPELRDAPAPSVTGRLYVRYPHHNADHEVIVDEAALPVTRVYAVLSDGTSSELVVDATGHFAFETHEDDEPYRLQIYSPLFPMLELQHDARKLDLPFHRFVRPDAVIAEPGTQLTYSIVDPIPSGAAHSVISTGQWMTAGAASGAASPFKINWDFPNVGTASGDPPTLISARAGDLIYFTESLADPEAYRIARYRVDEIEMQNAGNTSISGGMVAVTFNRCARLDIAFGTELARQGTAGYTGVSYGTWSLSSYPSLDVGTMYAPSIANARTSVTTDFALDFAYGNPFTGTPVLLAAMARARTSSFMTYVGAGTTAMVPVQADCTVATRIQPDVTLPSAITLDGAVLDVDGKQLVIDRTRPLDLTWTRRGNGRSHRTAVSLREVSETDPIGTVVATWITTGGAVRIDPVVLDIGKSYAFFVAEQLGYPNATSGDMKPAMPHVDGYMLSSTFIAN
jgi:hypothetical protein